MIYRGEENVSQGGRFCGSGTSKIANNHAWNASVGGRYSLERVLLVFWSAMAEIRRFCVILRTDRLYINNKTKPITINR